MTEPKLDPNYDPRSDGAMRTEDQKVVRPKDAATLIIVRRDAEKPRLLMGRRNKGHNFMPGKWVFPGGRIDRSDFRAPYCDDLRPEVAARVEQTAPPARARCRAPHACERHARLAAALRHALCRRRFPLGL